MCINRKLSHSPSDWYKTSGATNRSLFNPKYTTPWALCRGLPTSSITLLQPSEEGCRPEMVLSCKPTTTQCITSRRPLLTYSMLYANVMPHAALPSIGGMMRCTLIDLTVLSCELHSLCRLMLWSIFRYATVLDGLPYEIRSSISTFRRTSPINNK